MVFADTIHDRLHSYQNQASVLQQQANSQKQQESTAVQQAQSIQASISLAQETLGQVNNEIQQHKKNIADLEVQQQQLIDQQKQNIQTLSDYLRMEYENGGSPYQMYIDWLINSKDFSDLLSKTVYLSSILNFYGHLQSTIAEESKDLQVKHQAEQAETAQLAKSALSKQQMEEGLKSALSKQKEVINSLTKAEQQTLAQQNQVQKNIEETEQLIQAQEREAALAAQAKAQKERAAQEAADKAMGKLTAPVKLNGQIGQLISYASTFLGLPYVFGGDSPVTGFDCSSFVQYVYGHFGVKLNRVTWDQYTEGQSVNQADLKPGDLVFFQTYAPGPSHVGIYIGHRMMIDDSDFGVGYDSLDHPYWAARYYGARRVVVQ